MHSKIAEPPRKWPPAGNQTIRRLNKDVGVSSTYEAQVLGFQKLNIQILAPIRRPTASTIIRRAQAGRA